jgi:hypothetical protein
VRCDDITNYIGQFVIGAWSLQNAVVILCSAFIFQVPRRLESRRSAGRISERGRKDRQQNNSSLNEEPGTISRQKKHGKSYKCSGKPSAPETSDKKSEGLPRSPVKTFSLRKGRCDEGAVLGLSRP